MNEVYIDNKTFKGKDFTATPLHKGEYDSCIFDNCNFNESDISDITFIECVFNNCNLSMVKVANTTFNEVRFSGCKVLGVAFNDCNKFILELEFTDCQLNVASFYQLKLKNIRFVNCNLQEADFAEADLSGAKFSNCDLLSAIFDNTNLEKADLSSAYNYQLDPEANKIKKAKFSQNGIIGLLRKYNIRVE